MSASPRGRFLAVWKREAYSSRIHVFDLTEPTGEVLAVRDASEAEMVAFVPNSSKLVTVSNDKKARVFETRTWTKTAGYEWRLGRLRWLAPGQGHHLGYG